MLELASVIRIDPDVISTRITEWGNGLQNLRHVSPLSSPSLSSDVYQELLSIIIAYPFV